MRFLGKHLLIELVDCNPKILNDTDKIRSILLEAATRAGATIVGDTFHEFSPHGISGVVIIAESHLTIHTWPEYSYAAVDVFSCGDSIDPKIAFEYMVCQLESKNPSLVEVKRGIITEAEKS